MTLKSLAFSAIDLVERIPYSLIGLLSRLAIADVFWRSGQTKVDGWQVTQTTIDLFREEYRVPAPSARGRGLHGGDSGAPVFRPARDRPRLAPLRLWPFRHDHGDPDFRLSGELA